jgi:hypothetical protein
MAFLAGLFSGRTLRFERSQDGSIPSPASNIPVEHGGCATLSYGGGRWFESTRRDHLLIPFAKFAMKLPDRKLNSRICNNDDTPNRQKLFIAHLNLFRLRPSARTPVEQENSGQHREPGPFRVPQVLFDLEFLRRAKAASL